MPGAGTYEPEATSVQRKAPRFSMGIKLRSELDVRKDSPGPGQYVNSAEKFKQAAPRFGFGSSKRPEVGKQKDMTPGPGMY